MGLVVARFAAPQPLALLPRLRERAEALLGRKVTLVVEPPYSLITVSGLNVVVHEREQALEVSFGGVYWGRPPVEAVRRVLQSLGGVESRGWRSITYRFERAVPRTELVADVLGGRLVQRYPAWAYLRSGLRTSVEIALSDGGFELQAPIVIFGKLYDCALRAAEELATKVPLGSRGGSARPAGA